MAEQRFARFVRKAGPRVFVAADDEVAAFRLDAIVVEEDTHLILSAAPVARENREPPKALLSHADETFPKKPGSVIVVDRAAPVRLLAVVYDFDEEPPSQEEWVQSALRKIITECRERDLTSVSIPVLGAKYGPIRIERFAELLRSALSDDGDRMPALWDGFHGNH